MGSSAGGHLASTVATHAAKDAALAGIAALGGGTVVGTSSYAVTVVRTGTSTVLFQFDGGSRYKDVYKRQG